MTANAFLASYSAKVLEYTLAITYLILFVGFWRYVQGGKVAQAAKAVAHAPERIREAARGAAGWFSVPEAVYLHPGHTWARLESDGTVTVGLDDFAHRLVGPVAEVGLPQLGAGVSQGAAAIRLGADHKTVSMLSPVDGTVVAVNRSAAEQPERLGDPYGAGWLFKVKTSKLAANAKQLLSGEGARRWLDAAGESLAARLSPQLGHVLQDGGVPIHGIARELDPENWDHIAREFFLS
jgi:glycine cleavage system H lipoate-binding protein